MKAVIMAGGKGTRLRPLTSNTPKPMVPLLDRPVMEYTIELLKQHGITEIAVTVQYLPEMIRSYFGDGSDFGVQLHYFEEDSPLGTAGSVKNAEEFLDETFIVISGDALTDFNLTQAIEYHRHKGSIGTLILTHVDSPLEFGVVMTDDDGQIIRFLEKPSWGEVFSDTVNTGIYILETDVFNYFESGQVFDFSQDLFPLLMAQNQPLYAYVADGYWSDIGNLTQYRETQFDMLDRKVDIAMPGMEIAPGIWTGEHVKIDQDVILQSPCFIGSDCILEPHVTLEPYTIIGEGSILGRHTALERAVLWRNNLIALGAEVRGATLCQNVIVQSGAIVHEEAIVGDSCQIGTKSIVQPGVKIFPNKIIDHHTTVKHSFIRGDRLSKNLFGQSGVNGTCNVDLTTNFANRLALAYGTTIPAGKVVGVSHDSSPFAALIANVFLSGMHASGIHTYHFGSMTSSVSRHAVHHSDCAGGIHIRSLTEGGDNQFVIEFLDDAGLPLSKGAERKIENAYVQEDSRLIRPSKVGRARTAPNVRLQYREHLLSLIENRAIESQGYTVVLEYDYRNLQQIIPELLEILGCKVIQLNRVTSSPDELASWVTSSKADFGIRLDANGQHIDVVTEQGEVISESLLSILQIMIQLNHNNQPELHVPVNISHSAEILAAQMGRLVIRTKADSRSIMEGCQNQGFHIYSDGLYTLVHLMQLMADKNLRLSQLVDSIPDFTLLKEKVECPWADKGKVMRFLMEETKGKQVELIDGIKIFHDEGWTLILPDSEEPMFQVFANAGNHQTAKKLAMTYAQKIQDYRQRVLARPVSVAVQ